MLHDLKEIKQHVTNNKRCCNYNNTGDNGRNINDVDKKPKKKNVEYRDEKTCPGVVYEFFIQKQSTY